MKDELIYLDNISEDMKVKMKEAFDKLIPEQKEEFMNPKIFVGFGELVEPEEEELMIGLDLTDEDCYVKPRVMYMSHNDRS